VSEQASDSSLMMPLFTTMTDRQVDASASALLDAVAHVGSEL
jgi:hypothetical protein